MNLFSFQTSFTPIAALLNCNSQPFHFSQETVEENEVYCIFRYYLQPTKELVLRILEHGDKVEVLSPLTLRDETKEMIKKMLIRYSKSG